MTTFPEKYIRNVSVTKVISRSCEDHVINTPELQGEQLRKEFAEKLIKPRVVNLYVGNTGSSHDDGSCDNFYHHDDLYHNRINMVQLQ